MKLGDPFYCEVVKSNDDEFGNRVTMIKCHGRLTSDTSLAMKDTVKPLLPAGGRIIIDLGDVSYLDSSGLGTLVTLKVSAVKQGYCMLEFAEMTPRIMELLRISSLTQILSTRGS
jgi:anti-sigma B factor antagonist